MSGVQRSGQLSPNIQLSEIQKKETKSGNVNLLENNQEKVETKSTKSYPNQKSISKIIDANIVSGSELDGVFKKKEKPKTSLYQEAAKIENNNDDDDDDMDNLFSNVMSGLEDNDLDNMLDDISVKPKKENISSNNNQDSPIFSKKEKVSPFVAITESSSDVAPIQNSDNQKVIKLSTQANKLKSDIISSTRYDLGEGKIDVRFALFSKEGSIEFQKNASPESKAKMQFLKDVRDSINNPNPSKLDNIAEKYKGILGSAYKNYGQQKSFEDKLQFLSNNVDRFVREIKPDFEKFKNKELAKSLVSLANKNDNPKEYLNSLLKVESNFKDTATRKAIYSALQNYK